MSAPRAPFDLGTRASAHALRGALLSIFGMTALSVLGTSTLLSACGPAQSAGGSKTNWLKACDASVECGEAGSCICGLCTLPCEATTDCETGVCGSGVATATQCESYMAGEPKICLPEPEDEECSELALQDDPILGDLPEQTCSAAGALVCESFDSALPSGYATVLDGGQATLQDCNAYAGDGAISFSAEADGGAQTRLRLPESLDSGELHARFFMNIAGDAMLPSQLLLFEFWDGEDQAAVERNSFYLDGDGELFGYSTYYPHTFYTASLEPLARDQWLCIEIALGLSYDAYGTLSVRVDGEEHLGGSDLLLLGDNPISLAVLQSRIEYAEPGNATISYDELVIGTERIGCD